MVSLSCSAHGKLMAQLITIYLIDILWLVSCSECHSKGLRNGLFLRKLLKCLYCFLFLGLWRTFRFYKGHFNVLCYVIVTDKCFSTPASVFKVTDTSFIMTPLSILLPWVHKSFSCSKVKSPFVATLCVPISHIMIGPMKSGAWCRYVQCIAINW